MTRTLHRRLAWIVGAGMVCLTALLIARGLAGDKTPPKAKVSLDVGKFSVESPTKQMLAERTAPSTSSPAPGFINPKVEPGKVRWHKAFVAACAAAKESGKPVLLFQMMGNLDERFC
jgi:hypothetical protein